MKYDHIIWDWNGTLVNDAFLCVQIVNQILSERDLSTVDIRFYRENFCFPVNQYRLGSSLQWKSLSKSKLIFIEKYDFHNISVICMLMYSIYKLSKNRILTNRFYPQVISMMSAILKHHKIFNYFNVISELITFMQMERRKYH